MIPMVDDEFSEVLEDEEYPGKDYRLDTEMNRISGMVDELDAVKQAIYLILNTERYEYLIYPWDYGVEFEDLYGMPETYAIPEIERRVTEALLMDDRIVSVDSFEFEKIKRKMHVAFVAHCELGDVESEVDVDV